MKVFNENYFIGERGCYINHTKINDGYVISKTTSPHTIEEIGGMSGWFPNILIARPIGNQHVLIEGSGILANDPCKAYVFMFTLYENERTVVKLPGAFDLFRYDYKDVYVEFFDLTGEIDPKKSPTSFSIGGFPYAGSHNRQGLIQCSDSEIKSFFKWFLFSPIRVKYNLSYTYPGCVDSDKEGIISPTSYEVYYERVKEFGLKDIIS